MGDFFRNINYFVGEVRTIIRLNGISSILSVLSLSMIFLIAMIALSGWWISTDVVKALHEEAEISVYYDLTANTEIADLKKKIKSIKGVKGVFSIDAKKAYEQMEAFLEEDAEILSNFEENPFDPYLEVEIQIQELQPILVEIEKLPSVNYVRDNQTVLDKLQKIAQLIRVIGIGIAVAVSVSTFIITSHIIREGVHSHRNQINTLELLGAPDWFIRFPFVFEGVLITTTAGILASVGFVIFKSQLYKTLSEVVSFVSNLTLSWNMETLLAGMLLISFLMGLMASVVGLKMVKEK